MLRYPLVQQWRLLNFCATTYSRELSSFVNCNDVELFLNVSITQKSSSPFTKGTLIMLVTVNATTIECSHAVFILEDWVFEVILEYDTIFTTVITLHSKLYFETCVRTSSFNVSYFALTNSAAWRMIISELERITLTTTLIIFRHIGALRE
jgi:hypothetical protein